MSNPELEKAITETIERRDEAKDALREVANEITKGAWTPGEQAEWSADLWMYENEIDLHEQRLRMLRKQRR